MNPKSKNRSVAPSTSSSCLPGSENEREVDDANIRAIPTAKPGPSANLSITATKSGGVGTLTQCCQPRKHDFPSKRFRDITFTVSVVWQVEVVALWCEDGLRFASHAANLYSKNVLYLIKGAFSNWRKASSKFTLHEKSPIHKDIVRVLAGLKQMPISAILSDIAAKVQKTARKVLEILFCSDAFLG